MAQPILLPAAEADLDTIWLSIATENPAAADRFLDRILERCQALAEFPGMGSQRADLAPALRMSPLGEYLIFYRPIDDGIEVVRGLHGRRRITHRFFPSAS